MEKRNIYENKNPKLRELKQARYVEPLAKEVQRMARQINQRFYRLEKVGKENDTAYRYAIKETDKQKPRYSTNLDKLSQMSLNELYELGVQINAKLVSKTSTITGLNQIAEKRLSMSLDTIFKDDEKPSQENWRKFLENGGGELMNNKWYSSFQIAEDWREIVDKGGVTIKQFIKTYKQQEKKKDDIDYGIIRKRLKNLVKKR